VVKVLDRGPFIRGRDLDISTAAARALGIYEQGVEQVEVRVLEHPRQQIFSTPRS
jgi:rare lipoprotein A